MSNSVEMTGNHFQQNISVKLTYTVLDTFSKENFMKFSVNLTEFFDSELNT